MGVIVRKTAVFMNFDGAPGGAERRFARVFNHIFQAEKNLFMIINLAGLASLARNHIELKGDRVLHIGSPSSQLKVLSNIRKFALLFQLWALIIKRRVRHVHYPVGPTFYSFVHSYIAELVGVTYSISIVNSTTTSLKDLGWRGGIIWGRSIKYASRLDILSDGIVRNVERIFGMLPPYEISPCSFTDYSRSYTCAEKKYEFTMMSRLVPGKGHDLLMGALEYIEDKYPEEASKFGCIGIFGDGPIKPWLIEKVNKLSRFDIALSYSNDPFSILAETRFFLSLQEKENYPSQAILEAMSCGAVVLATDVGETEKMVPDELGYRLSPSCDALAKTMLKAKDSEQDILSRSALAIQFAKAEHTVERFSEYFSRFLTSASAK